MEMTKKDIVNSDKTGRITTPNASGSKMNGGGKVVNARKRVNALYPLEPTTISETQLDIAIMNAIEKRLHAGK